MTQRIPDRSRFPRPSALPLAAGLAILLLATAPSRASRIAYTITGSVVQAEGVDGVQVGDSITGLIAYATDLTPSSGDPSTDTGQAYSGDIEFHFETSSKTFAIADPLSSAVFVEDIAAGAPTDGENPPGDNFGALIAAKAGGPSADSQFLTFGLLDETGSVFDSTSLPLSIDFARFDTGVVVAYDGNGGIVTAIIDSLKPTTVPEPGSVTIFCAAAVFVRLWLRRGKGSTSAA